MGDGSSSYHGYCSSTWRGMYNIIYNISELVTRCLMKFLSETNMVQGKPPDYHDFVGIVVLLVINSTISFIEENNAGNAAAALMARLAPKAKVC